MHKFGLEHLDKSLEMSSHLDVVEVLRQFQAGYTRRNVENVDTFIKELFITGENTCILGTGTGELVFGSKKVKKLIEDDWKYWGDVTIDWENARIAVAKEVAWFATSGSVKHIFTDSPKRDKSYLDFIKAKAEEPGLTPKQKIAFINWVLALSYHQRLQSKREYLWPLRLSGVLLRDGGKWKNVHLHFSFPKANFPDERFENAKEHQKNYNKHNTLADEYKNNQMTPEVKNLLKSLEKKLINQNTITEELVSKFFPMDNLPYIIGPDNQWFVGVDQIRNFFTSKRKVTLSLDLEHAIANKSGNITWVTATGVFKQNLTEDQLGEIALAELSNIFQTDLTVQEKLFAAKKNIAYVLKETASGAKYTSPIRLTAVISNQNSGLAFQQIHFSYPNYWIFEEKIASI